MTVTAPTEDEIQDALNVLRRDYLADVENVANDFAEQWRSGEFATRDDAIETLEQTIDGTRRVIITRDAILTALFSDNADAYQDEVGSEPESPSQAAFFAFKADVIRELGRHGIDPNYDEPGPSEVEVAAQQTRDMAAALVAVVPTTLAVSYDEEEGEIVLDGGHHAEAVCIEVIRYNPDEWGVKTDVPGFEDSELDSLTTEQAVQEVCRIAASWEESLVA